MSGTVAILGSPRAGGILIIADHASAHVPDDIDFGIDPALLSTHIAIDLGVAGVAARLVDGFGVAAIPGHVSRLVVDLNRHADEPAAIPVSSDGVAIPGNAIDPAERAARIARFHAPYHDAIARTLDTAPPALIISLHSFTPRLATRPEEARPWQVGILYNRIVAPSRAAIRILTRAGLNVGDQQPYSGRLLNATMDRHAEARNIPYVGVEMRQDEVADDAGQARYAALIGAMAQEIVAGLASCDII